METALGEMALALDHPAAALGFFAAAAVGVASSLHCLLMCGPLACAGLGGLGRRGGRWAAIGAYQGGRFLAYALVGLLLGGLGGGLARLLAVSVQPYLPWVLALTLVATAFDLGRRLPSIPVLGRLAGKAASLSRGLSPVARSATIGALTPLLPCGVLYGIFVAALATGSAVGGGLVMGGFALGSAGALLLAQLQLGLWRKLPPAAARAVQRGVPLLAAAVVVWRALAGGGGEAPPSCH